MAGEPGTCVFCGSGPLTLEHVFPQWVRPHVGAVEPIGSATRVSHHEEHVHHSYGTAVIDFKARRVCADCNGGWMSDMEGAVIPILTPMILSPGRVDLTRDEAMTLAAWIAKTSLTTALIYPETDHEVPHRFFDEMYRERQPFEDAVIWIAGYDASRYAVSHSQVPILNIGFRTTVNVGCFVFKITALDDGAHSMVLPDDELVPYLSQLWPEPRPDELGDRLAEAWPGYTHLGREAPVLNDVGLRDLSEVDPHSWGVEGHEQPPSARP